MRTGLEKMRSSELYTFADPEVDGSAAMHRRCMPVCRP